MDVYGINEFLGIAQHRDGVFLNTGTAIDARNMDTSDGNLSVAKGYIRKSSNAIPGTDKVLRLIPVDEKHVLAVTQSAIYHGDYTAWGEVPLYTFAEPSGEDIQVDYVQAQINLDVVVIVATGTQQMVKITFGETITAGLFGSGQYLYESTVAGYEGRNITLETALTEEAKTALTSDGGITVNNTYIKATAKDDTTLILAEKPTKAPTTEDKVKINTVSYTGSVESYADKVITVKDKMTTEQQTALTNSGGIYLDDKWFAAKPTTETTITLSSTPPTEPAPEQVVKIRTSTFESAITAYSDKLIVTLTDLMSDEQQVKLTVEGGLYINDVFVKAEVSTAFSVVLTEEPKEQPEAGQSAKIRGGASDAKCNYVVMHYNRLFAAGDPENPTRLYWSTIPGDGRTIEHWLIVSASVDLSGGYVEVGNNANDPIIGLCALSNQIIIFKRYSIYRLYGDRPSYYTVERIERFTENMSNASVAVKADIPYWLTKSGIKYFDGVGVQLLDNGDNLLRSFLETVKSVSACKGFVGREKLYFSCRTGPGEYDDALIVYDMARSTYMVRDGFNIGDISSFDGAIHMLNDGRYLYEFDKGDKYDGRAISAYWQTQPTDLGAKYYKKQLKEILFRATGKTIIFDITNGNSKATERRVVQDEEMIEIPLHSEECRRFSIKISNEAGSAFTIRGGMQVLYEGSVRPR